MLYGIADYISYYVHGISSMIVTMGLCSNAGVHDITVCCLIGDQFIS